MLQKILDERKLSFQIFLKYFLYLLCAIFIFANLYVVAYFPWHNNTYLYTDAARDFHIFREIDSKKLILIGARSSVGNLFHGPLWQYLTYPGYLLGQGNPVTVAWYWFFLTVVFIGSGIYFAKKIFGTAAAIVYALMLSANMLAYNSFLINPHGALFVMPTFLGSIILFYKTSKIKYLIIHIITAVAIMQFQLALGIPLIGLSAILIISYCIKIKKYSPLYVFLLIPLFLSNFILFDIRHNFSMTKKAFLYASPYDNAGIHSVQEMFLDRFNFIKNTRVDLTPTYSIQLAVFLVICALIIVQIRSNNHKAFYYIASYYYIGFFLLSCFSKWTLLDHQVFPIFAISTLIFASLITSKNRIALSVFALVLLFSLYQNYYYIPRVISSSENLIRIDPRSWSNLKQVAEDISTKTKGPFGYFVYSPDAVAYAPRYAAIYVFKKNKLEANEYKKMNETFIIAEPPPADNPFMKTQWWIENKVKINKAATETKSFDSGYGWEKYTLNQDEQSVPFDPDINIGLLFR